MPQIPKNNNYFKDFVTAWQTKPVAEVAEQFQLSENRCKSIACDLKNLGIPLRKHIHPNKFSKELISELTDLAKNAQQAP
jgi:hypothetical protein